MFLAAILLIILKPKEDNVNMEQPESQNLSINSDKLLYLGHASLRITTADDKTIYIDPYAGSDYEKPADLILVTHNHFDHNAIDKVKNRNSGAQIVTALEALKDGKHNTFDFGYAKVEAVEAGYNSYHDVKKCVGYIITLASGVSLYVAGDTYITPQMPEFSARNLDYAFIPTDGTYTMTAEEASQVADTINAKHSIPYHMNPNKDFDETIAERFSAKNKLVVKPGEEIAIRKG